jgi:nicotinamidase-related amidase
MQFGRLSPGPTTISFRKHFVSTGRADAVARKEDSPMTEHNIPEREKAALLTVDLQRDFVRGDSPVRATGAGLVLPRVKAILETFRARRAPIFHAVRLYRPDGSNVDLCRRAAVEEGLRVLMPGTLGAELLDEVRPKGSPRLDSLSLLSGEFQEIADQEWVFYKPRWGAFFNTGLEDSLRARGITTLVVSGCNFPTGTRASIYEACARDFRVVVVSDAVSDASDEGLRELGRMGAYLMTAEACLDWLRGAQSSSAA